MGVLNETSFPSFVRYEPTVDNEKQKRNNLQRFQQLLETSREKLSLVTQLWVTDWGFSQVVAYHVRNVSFAWSQERSKSTRKPANRIESSTRLWHPQMCSFHRMSQKRQRNHTRKLDFLIQSSAEMWSKRSDKGKQRKAQKQTFSGRVFSDSCLISRIAGFFFVRMPFLRTFPAASVNTIIYAHY